MQRPDRVPLEKPSAFALAGFCPKRISGGLRLSSHCHLFACCYSFFHRSDTAIFDKDPLGRSIP
jgi:hypothetical protein